jgi:hypothetical protein
MIKTLCFALLFSGGVLLAQDTMTRQNGGDSNGSVTVQGCVSRESGDYVLIKQDPGETYELQATNHIKLHDYLGQHVEVQGTKSPSMSTSSDSSARSGSPSPTTLTISSIKTLDKECHAH